MLYMMDGFDYVVDPQMKKWSTQTPGLNSGLWKGGLPMENELELVTFSDMNDPDYQLSTKGGPTSKRAFELAEQEGMNVVLPKPEQVQIDIDSEQNFALYQNHLVIVQRYAKYLDLTLVEEEIHPSKSGLPKRHITLTFDREITNIHRILLQALLGSDLKRELLGLIQQAKGDPHPTLFLEKKPPKQVLMLAEGNIQ